MTWPEGIPPQTQRLLLGPTERAVVLALCQQREGYHRSHGATPLCLSLAELSQRTCMTPKNTRRTISRANAKLAAQSLVIISFHAQASLGPFGYALFQLSEIVAGT